MPNLIVSRRKLFIPDPRNTVRRLMYVFTTPEDTRRLFYEESYMFYFQEDKIQYFVFSYGFKWTILYIWVSIYVSDTHTRLYLISRTSMQFIVFVRWAAITNTVQPSAAAEIQRHRSTQRLIPKCKYYNAYKKVSHFSFIYLSITDFYLPQFPRSILQLCTGRYDMNSITQAQRYRIFVDKLIFD